MCAFVFYFTLSATMKQLHALLLIFLFACYHSRAQKTVPITFAKNFSQNIWTDTGTVKHPRIYIGDRKVTITSRDNLIDNLIFADKRFKQNFKNCEMSVQKDISIDRCEVLLDTTVSEDSATAFVDCGEEIAYINYMGDIEILRSKAPDGYELRFETSANDHVITMQLDTVSFLHIRLGEKGKFITARNVFKNAVTIEGTHPDVITIASNSFGEGATLDVQDSKVHFFGFVDNDGVNTKVRFLYDTIQGAIKFHDNDIIGESKRSKRKLDVEFFKTVFNAPLVSGYIASKSKITFEECVFNSGANLTNLGFDTVIFKNCFNINGQLLLSPDTSLHKVYLSFVNTNFVNIKFDYNGRYELFFDSVSLMNKDLVSGTYENLLAKFKVEGKNLSYQNTDIEYIQYQNKEEGLNGKLSDIISRAWWYYGYRKYYIIYWTIGLLLFFYFCNIRMWQAMQEAYPLIPREKQSYYERVTSNESQKIKFYVNSFVYTAFIFFSLKVDFDKLTYKKSGILLYFFTQYFAGLICVFFIANAILKI